MPKGLEDGLNSTCKELSKELNVSIVMISGPDWNDALTPWPANGIFKKEKPFGGNAARFLDELTNEVIPEIESDIFQHSPTRTLAGISLSGLFAVWTMFNSSFFKNFISLSGSFWYEGFVEWIENQKVPDKETRIYITLGNREHLSKSKVFSTIDTCTERVVRHLQKQLTQIEYEQFEGTHFTPMNENLKKALEFIYKGRNQAF